VVIAWAGGAAFVVSLGYLVYFYLVTLADPGGEPDARLRNAAIDALLFFAFALHHSLFARPAAKRVVGRLVSPRLERSIYVWIASALAVALCLLWQPVAGTLYRIEGWWRTVFWATQLSGAVIAMRATRAMSALELAGIHQAAGRTNPRPLSSAGPFWLVRHPIYLGWMLMVFATPALTANRFVFAVISSLYLILAIPWEERSLVAAHGDQYRAYQRTVRWRVIPGVW
jgi:protein-S-isoprenylcysteine O-methyltransferase Ste14